MKPDKTFAITTVFLGGLLLIQVAAVISHKPQARYHASWVNLADTLGEGVAQSTQVVLGEVIKVRRAPDIVVRIPGQHGEVDRIPTEIVTIEVQKTYKDREGSVREGSTVEVFHTGLGNQPRIIPADDEEDEAEGEDQQGQGKGQKRGKRPRTDVEGRSIHLEDDPPYQVGEQYVLFLRNGPDLDGTLSIKRAIAPEGRYRIATGDILDPVTATRGFAPKWAGKPLTELETALGNLP